MGNFHKKHKGWIIFLVFVVVFTIIFTSYGYAALNTKLQISGEALVEVDADIRVTGLNVLSLNNGAYETYNNKFAKDSTTMYVTLPSSASIIYEIEVTNKSNEDYMLGNLDADFKNINYELLNFHVYDVIEKQSKKLIEVKVSNSNANSTIDVLNLDYQFELVQTTAPVLQGGGSSWITSPSIVNVKTPGIAPNGLKYYEYYVSSSKTDVPNKDTIATGTTKDDYSFTVGGIYYIYYRTVSNYGTKSDWTKVQTVKNYKTPMQIIPNMAPHAGGTQVRLEFNAYDCILANSHLHYEFIVKTDGVIDLDFNDIHFNSTITALGNNRYRITGLLTITEDMITAKQYEYDKMRFIDVNAKYGGAEYTATYMEVESYSIILQ